MRGTAVARVFNNNPTLVFPLFGGGWYPYGSGFGWNRGFGYNACRYGASPWMWGRYDSWYDPYYSYYSGCGYGYGSYDPYYYGGGYSTSAASTTSTTRGATGSIRFRVKPSTAKIYIDGTLLGVVDDFDGLFGHLVLEGGPHQLELRADGYQTYTADINVEVGKTTTQRITLKKQ